MPKLVPDHLALAREVRYSFRLLFYYITDRKQFSGEEAIRQRCLLEKITEAARAGIDFIQLREKDLPVCDLESLASKALHAIHQNSPKTRLFINSRTDIALAIGAGGVHLPSQDISPVVARRIWNGMISVSCHSPVEVSDAAEAGADYALFAPVFEKKDATPAGLAALREACQYRVPVLALGGVTLENSASCLEAGAAGIAAIRLFQENDVAKIVRKFRN